MSWKALHDALVRLVSLERRIDPFFRPARDALLREPLAIATQALLRLVREAPSGLPAPETPRPGEEEHVRAIVASMSASGRAIYRPGAYERAGNTKTHGVVRGRFIVEASLPAELRHGVFAYPWTARRIHSFLLELQNLFADLLSCERIVTAANEDLMPSACRREGVNSFAPDP